MAKKFFMISESEKENLNWILSRIFYNEQIGKKCYVLTSNILNYADIFEAYNKAFHRVCPASIFSDKIELTENDSLCVNDLLGNFHCNVLNVIKDNEDRCSYMYITLVGNVADYKCADIDPDQVSMDIEVTK